MDHRTHAEIVNDVAKLIIGRLVSRALGHRPDILEKAKERLEKKAEREGDTDYIQMWRHLLEGPIEHVRRTLISRDEESYWLRLTSPFSAADADFPIRDEEFRRRLWKDARRLVIMGHSYNRSAAYDQSADTNNRRLG